MDIKPVTRSSSDGTIVNNALLEGVGARHKDHFQSQEGGGYLDNCTDFEIFEKKSRDPRLDELDDMGVGGFWRDMANEIGFDAFMVVWERLSGQAASRDDGNRVYVPRFDAFMRYQRNRFLLSLASTGLKSKEIRVHVLSELNEDISVNHISRLIRQNTAK